MYVRSSPLAGPLAAIAHQLIHLAGHRHRRRVLPGARRRQTRSDLSGGPRHTRQPAREEVSQSQPRGLVGRRRWARAVRNRGGTRHTPAQVRGGSILQFRASSHRATSFGNKSRP